MVEKKRRRRTRSRGAFVELRKVGVGEEVHFCANARRPTKFYSAEFSKKICAHIIFHRKFSFTCSAEELILPPKPGCYDQSEV